MISNSNNSSNLGTDNSQTNPSGSSTGETGNSSYNKLDERVKIIENGLLKASYGIKKTQKNIRYLRKSSINIIEIIGIFVTLFTFISVDVQIFKNMASLNNAVFFVILMFFCLIGFVFFLHIVLNNEVKIINFCILAGILLAIMGFFCITQYFDKPIKLEDTNKTKDLQERINNLEQKMSVFNEVELIKVSNQNFIK